MYLNWIVLVVFSCNPPQPHSPQCCLPYKYYVHTHKHTYTHTRTRTHIYTHTHIHTHTHAHSHTHTQHTHIHVCNSASFIQLRICAGMLVNRPTCTYGTESKNSLGNCVLERRIIHKCSLSNYCFKVPGRGHCIIH